MSKPTLNVNCTICGTRFDVLAGGCHDCYPPLRINPEGVTAQFTRLVVELMRASGLPASEASRIVEHSVVAMSMSRALQERQKGWGFVR
jgi:hypothetical protein